MCLNFCDGMTNNEVPDQTAFRGSVSRPKDEIMIE